MPTCERCDQENEAYGEANTHRMQEICTNFGVLTTLCYDCRKAWHTFSYNHTLFKEYSLIGFRLKCWNMRYRRHPLECDVKDGEAFLAQLEELEPKINKIVTNWIKGSYVKPK